jgi:site-specific DNA-methyltransferase (adenine-specific)/modification methylase
MHTVADFELAWTNIDFPAKAFDALRNPDGRREHPTQKPLTLMSWCIGQADRANGGDVQTILDPFAGSCTTGRAAKDLGRRCVCIEREERYAEIGARRMQQEVLNPTEAQ